MIHFTAESKKCQCFSDYCRTAILLFDTGNNKHLDVHDGELFQIELRVAAGPSKVLKCLK